MFWKKLKIAAAVLLACAVTAGVGDVTNRVAIAEGRVAVIGAADEAKRPDAAAREIDLRGYTAEWRSGSVLKPAEIKTAEGLATAVPDEEWRAKITRQVDFSKEKLLFFVWLGSSGDRLTFTPAGDADGPVVVFRYAERFEHMMKAPQHFRLYALPRETAWKVVTEKMDPLRIDPHAPSKDDPTAKLPNKDDPTAKLLKDLDSDNAFVRAAAIDLLGERRAKEAVPRLIDLVGDGAALIGSDNYVGSHATNALGRITGQPFGVDEKQWRAWWKEQRKEAAGPEVAADSAVKVLSAEATVELRGLLVHTPKGTFIMVREQRPFAVAPAEREGEVVTWELDFGKKPDDLEQQAKDLSGKTVVVSGTCKMAATLTFGANPMNPSAPSGSEWRLEKTVAVSRLIAAEKK